MSTTTIPQIPLFPEAAVVTLPAKKLVGISVRTSMEKAFADCTALWEQFYPWMLRVHGLKEEGFACPSFGLSMDADMQTGQFTYWAAIEVQDSFVDPAQWPSGFGTVDLSAGPYVGTGVASLSNMTEAYTYLYGPWAQSHREHELNFGGICFEYYDERYLKNGSVEIFAPLRGAAN